MNRNIKNPSYRKFDTHMKKEEQPGTQRDDSEDECPVDVGDDNESINPTSQRSKTA